MVDVTEIQNTIKCGLKRAWDTHFILTDERNEDIRPECLTTAAICYSFADYISREKLNGQIVVRSEEKTRTIWSKAFLASFLKRGTRSGLKRDSLRKGNVDISVFTLGDGFAKAFAVLESKGFLTFTSRGELYSGSKSELEKDIKRNVEFVKEGSAEGGIEYSAFTFYMRDKASVIDSEAQRFCQEKQAYFYSVAKTLLGHNSLLQLDVTIDTLSANLFASKKEANAIDDTGCPAHVAEGHWHVAYGIISIFKPNKIVTCNNSRSTSLRVFDDITRACPDDQY